MHSTTTSGLSRTDPDDIVTYVPQDLRQYLVDTEKPYEIYRLVGQEHDRRIRLLLRRFTNQIQHGCKNTHCNVPTCLSYRKRTSPGPLRPHTDLTARALAVKCLEQYTTHGRDLSRNPNRDKGKRRQAIPSHDGLCWNDPVVPWYSNPDEYFARLDRVVKRRSSEERRCSVSSPIATKNPPATQLTSRPTVARQKFSGPLDSHGVAQQSHMHTNPETQTQSDIQTNNGASSHPPVSLTSKFKTPTPINGHVQQPVAVREARNRKDYDQASLAQALFKHSRLYFWSGSPGGPDTGTQTTREEQQDGQVVDTSTPSLNTRQAIPGMGNLHVDRPVTTFRILPSKAIRWFREVSLECREEDGQLPENIRAFLDQCLFFVIGNPTRFLQSVSTWRSEQDASSTGELENSQLVLPTPRVVVQTREMIEQCYPDSEERFHLATHLLSALQNSYGLPHYIKQYSSLTADSRRQHEFLSNFQIAHIILVVLSMLPSATLSLATLPKPQDHVDSNSTSNGTRHEQNSGTMSIRRLPLSHDAREHVSPSMNGTPLSSDHHIATCQLRESIADLISHRIAIDSTAKTLRKKPVGLEHGHGIVSGIVSLMQGSLDNVGQPLLDEHHAIHMLSSMQMVVLLKWDRTPIIRRTGPVGGALEMLKGLFVRRKHLSLDHTLFCMDCIPAALDEVEMPFDWLSFKPDATKMHILQFSFLFPPHTIVRYFRSLNLKVMKQSHEKAMAVYTNGRAQLLYPAWKVANIDEVLNLTRSHMARYFVMTIRRSEILEDAIGQIWQRERRELLRPLKVVLGKEEGENGLDHGGVQQEFFRLAFAQAFDPSYGMFNVDPTTHMTWFRPGSLEQMYKYEALGILMSLAIYNGVTVPITMPLAFYRKILGMKVKSIDHVEDGWPELAQSFSQLLTWSEGDVEDVMALTYDFSYDICGRTVTIDMAKKPAHAQMTTAVRKSAKGKERALPFTTTNFQPVQPIHEITDMGSFSPNSDSDIDEPLQDQQPTTSTPVTNANRDAFVHSYIEHLTNKTIRPQFTSFLKGLHTLLSPTALSLFTPSHLKLLFEGHPTSHAISVPLWRAATKYEDFTPDDPLIIWFWEILENDFTQTQMRKLLEFVTASNRLPVGGWEGVTFIVQRNGGGDERLPGSSTCYGRLLLPEYSCKEVLRERLTKAVEEGLGFGMI